MIRVLQLVTALAGGGVGSVISNYYHYIDDDFVFDFVVNEKTGSSLEKEIEKKGGKIFVVPPLRKGFFKHISSLIKVLKKNKGSILHSNYGEKSLFFLFFSWLFGFKKRILHVHSSKRPERRLEMIKRKLLTSLCVVFATDKVACGTEAAEWFYGKKYRKKSIIILRNAIRLNDYLFDNKTRELERSKYMFKDCFVIGNVGRLSFPKNHRFMIDLFSEIHKIDNRFILAFAGSGELESELMNLVAQRNLQTHIKFLGLVNDVNALLNAFDVFLLPSISEGVPVAGIEALANGLTVVCSSAVTKEICIDKSVYYLSLNDSFDAWIDKIINAGRCGNSNIDKLKQLGFDIEQEAHNLKDLYLRWR